MIFDHYLTVQSWKRDFDTDQTNLKSLLVWIRIPCLPIEYYEYSFLMRLGAKFGKPIKIDEATSIVSRRHFARLCVEVDLSKPLISKFRLRQRVRRVEYEGIPMVCFECGRYGHRVWKIWASKRFLPIQHLFYAFSHQSPESQCW